MNKIKSELKNLIPAYLDELDAVDVSAYYDYKFSDEYKKKMSDLLRRRKRFYYPLIKTQMRKAACIAAAVVIAAFCSLGFKPVRQIVYNFFIKHHADHDRVTVVKEERESSSVPELIEEIYEVTYIPDGYVLDESEDSIVNVYRFWKKGEYRLNFNQYTMDIATNLDNEDSNVSKKTIDSQEYIIREPIDEDPYGSTEIMWNNGRYVFDIYADDLDTETLIKMAQSVKKTDKKIESDF